MIEMQNTEYKNPAVVHVGKIAVSNLKVEGEEIFDDIEHYIEVIKQQQCQQLQEREAK